MSFATKMDHLRTLSTEVLQEELLQCRGRERAETAALIAHLAEVDRRKLYSALGYSSLFAYCDNELGHTEAVGPVGRPSNAADRSGTGRSATGRSITGRRITSCPQDGRRLNDPVGARDVLPLR